MIVLTRMTKRLRGSLLIWSCVLTIAVGIFAICGAALTNPAFSRESFRTSMNALILVGMFLESFDKVFSALNRGAKISERASRITANCGAFVLIAALFLEVFTTPLVATSLLQHRVVRYGLAIVLIGAIVGPCAYMKRRMNALT